MGFGELVFILIVVLLFFGAGKLGGLGAGLGKAARDVKDALGADRPQPKPEPPALPPEEPKA